MKITVIGGGGVRSPFLAKSLALSAADVGITEVSFMDIDEDKLLIYGKIAKEIFKRISPNVNFTLTMDSKEALLGSDYIITTIRASGDDGRVIDERTALTLGVLGQETTGAGGFAMALRSIPVLKKYCEEVRVYSNPNAVVFNFTNPSGLVTQALHTMGFKNVYGVCDAPASFFNQIKHLLGKENITAECYGLNHLSWFYNFMENDKDILEQILESPKLYEDTEMRLFNKDIVQMCEYQLPNEYLYFYYFRDRAVSSVLKCDMTRGETIKKINVHMLNELKSIDIDNDFDKAFESFMQHFAMRENSYFSIECGKVRKDIFKVPTVDEYIKSPDNGSYAAVALDFIRAKELNKKVHMVMSIPNNGAISFLKDNDVCELSCIVDKNGVHTHKVNHIPAMQKNLILTVKQYENLTVEAIMEKSKIKAVQALMMHPLVCSYTLAEKLVEEYTKIYKSYIGEWK